MDTKLLEIKEGDQHIPLAVPATRGESRCSLSKVAKLVSATAIGVSTGVAMMPIFNYEARTLEKYGIDVHSTEAINTAFTINTLATYSILSGISVHHLIKHYHQYFSGGTLSKLQKAALAATALSSAILPLSQLWTVELHNQKFSDSTGFDRFMQWATFTSLQLTIYRTLESYGQVSDHFQSRYKQVSLDTIGSKLSVYGLALSSLLGKFVAYNYAGYTLFQMLAAPKELAVIGGIVVGGIIGAGGLAAAEHLAVKSLFEKQEYPSTTKEKIAGVFSAIEGAWCTLPLISTGIRAMEDWQPLTKGLLFVPLFMSHTVLEAKTIYRNMTLPKHKSKLYNAESFYKTFDFLEDYNSDSTHQNLQSTYNSCNIKPWACYLLAATAMGHQKAAEALANCFWEGKWGVTEVGIIKTELSYMANYIANPEYEGGRRDMSSARKAKLKELAEYLTGVKKELGAKRVTSKEIKQLVQDFNDKTKELDQTEENTANKLYEKGILSYFSTHHEHEEAAEEFSSSSIPHEDGQGNRVSVYSVDLGHDAATAGASFSVEHFNSWLQRYDAVQLSGDNLQIPDAVSNHVPNCTIL